MNEGHLFLYSSVKPIEKGHDPDGKISPILPLCGKLPESAAFLNIALNRLITIKDVYFLLACLLSTEKHPLCLRRKIQLR